MNIASKYLKKSMAPELPDNNAVIAAKPADNSWGWLPTLSLTSAVGVFLVALAFNMGRVASPWSEPLFWFSLLVLFLPIAWRLFSAGPARRERIALLIVLGIALYFVKFLQYPLYFAYFDEFIHLRTAYDIVASEHLFHPNPILSISPFYPGLEIATSALSSVTGLSLFASGIVLIGVVRLVFVLALYLFYEHISNSVRVAGIATVLYMANPGFLFSDSGFAYESLALALAVFVLFALALRCWGPAGRQRGLTLAIWLGLGVLVITHHMTSYLLIAFLLLWTVTWMVTSFHRNRDQKDQRPSEKTLEASSRLSLKLFSRRLSRGMSRPFQAAFQIGPGGVALLSLVLSAAWLKFTGDLTVGYLTPYLTTAGNQLAQILTGEGTIRRMFYDGSGYVLPLWERVMAYASVALILLGLPFGLFQIWRHHRTNATILALAGGALAYPTSLALRLTLSGAEISERSSEFVFLGVAFVLAIGATKFWLSRARNWRHSVMIIGLVGVIFVGQIVTGNGQSWARIPGPYLVVADQRSIEPEGIAAAKWADSYLGSGHRIATDRINMLLMATYGNEWVVVASNAKVSPSWVFYSPQVGPNVEAILRYDRIQYLVVDRRLSTGLPRVGVYFDGEVPGPSLHAKPIDPAALAKFDGVQNVSRVFDSGDIVIYDIEAIASGQPATSTPKPSCTPALPTAISSSYPEITRQYIGTIQDIATSLTTEMSFTDIQQQQGSICGSFTGLNETGTFKGSITIDGHIQFVFTYQAGQPLLTFDGHIQPDGTLGGSYCHFVAGNCSDYGIWSLSPKTQGGVYERRTRS
jgi:hypothetical protein